MTEEPPQTQPEQPSSSVNASPHAMYYAPQSKKKQFSEVVRNVQNHSAYKKGKEVLLEKKTLYSIGVALFVILALTLIFMIPEPTEPIEGEWMKADGEVYTFKGNGQVISGIQMTSAWTTDGSQLTLITELNYMDESSQLTSRLVVQNIQFTMTEDENAMWWSWQSVLIDDQEQDIAEPQCALLLRTSIAENTYEYSVVSDNYNNEKPESCTQNA